MPTQLTPDSKNRMYPPVVSGNPIEGLWTPTSDQKYHLETRYADKFGNVYYYSKAGSVALVAGTLQQSAPLGGADTTDQVNLTVATSSAIGDKFGYATVSTTSQVGGLFDEGYYVIDAGTAAQGGGLMYRIKNDDVAKGVADALDKAVSHKFTFYNPCRTTIVASSSTVRLLVNPYKNTIVTPNTTITGGCIGVATMAVPAGYYYWLQTYGICSVLCGGGDDIVAGEPALRSIVADGEIIADTAALVGEEIGGTLCAASDGDFTPMLLRIRA